MAHTTTTDLDQALPGGPKRPHCTAIDTGTLVCPALDNTTRTLSLGVTLDGTVKFT